MIAVAEITESDNAQAGADGTQADGLPAEDGAMAFALGRARRAPDSVLGPVNSSAWYGAYDAAAAKVPGTMQYEAAQRLTLFPLGSRVRVVGYDKRLGDARSLNGRTGSVHRGHFGGLYVTLDRRPREKTEKVELITWKLGQTPTLELVGA